MSSILIEIDILAPIHYCSVFVDCEFLCLVNLVKKNEEKKMLILLFWNIFFTQRIHIIVSEVVNVITSVT